MAAGVGSSIFFSFSLLVISLLVLLLLRYYLPIRSTPGYLLLPVFLSLALPSSIILLVPIDLASNAGTGAARGIWLPDRALLVAWRITYWLTFILTWYGFGIAALDRSGMLTRGQVRITFTWRILGFWISRTKRPLYLLSALQCSLPTHRPLHRSRRCRLFLPD